MEKKDNVMEDSYARKSIICMRSCKLFWKRALVGSVHKESGLFKFSDEASDVLGVSAVDLQASASDFSLL